MENYPSPYINKDTKDTNTGTSNIMENYPSPYINKDTKDPNTGADNFSDSAGCSSASSTETLKPAQHQEHIVVRHETVECQVDCSRNRVKSVEDGYFSHESDFAKTKLNPGAGENTRVPDGANNQLSRVESNVSIVSVDMSTCQTTTSARSPIPHEFVTSGSLQTLGEKSSSCGEILGSRSSLSKRSLKGKVFYVLEATWSEILFFNHTFIGLVCYLFISHTYAYYLHLSTISSVIAGSW